MLKKLTTKPVWYWERYRPYPIINAWKHLPAQPSTSSSSLVLAILTTPSTLYMAAWSAYSWRRNIGVSVSIRIYVDGRVNPIFANSLSSVLPGVEVYSASMPDEDLKINSPAMYRFCSTHATGRKLLLILKLQEESNLLFSDCDVLLFRKPIELLYCIRNQTSAFNQEKDSACYDNQVLEKATELGIRPSEYLNAGLLFIAKNSINQKTAESLLSGVAYPSISWVTEQTVLACLMNLASGSPLPKDRYVVSAERQFWWQQDVNYNIVISRHFTGTVRHLLYMNGYPRIQKQATFHDN